MTDEKQSDLKILTLDRNPNPISKKILVGIPTLGLVRVEWALSTLMKGFYLRPTNAMAHIRMPVGHDVPSGRNNIVEEALEKGFDWILFIDDDTIPPPDYFLRFWDYMVEAKKPIVSGLYYTKSSQPEPLVYRGRGNGPYYDWEHGDKFWVDGCGLGCAILHTSIFRHLRPPWFRNVRSFKIEEDGLSVAVRGTEDLDFIDRLIEEDTLKKAGWEVPDPLNPVFMDTSIVSKHIDASTGNIYPECRGEEHLIHHKAVRAHYEAQREREKEAS